MIEYGIMVRGQLIHLKKPREGCKIVIWTEEPQLTSEESANYYYSYHWEESPQYYTQVWDKIEVNENGR